MTSSSPSLSIAFTPDGLSRPRGGVKRYADELFVRFGQLGHSVSITGRGLPDGPAPRRLRVATSHLRELARPSHADVIFCPFLDLPPRTHPSVPIVATIHDLTGFRFPRQTVAGYLSRRSLRRAIDLADHLICDSFATQTDVVAQGVDPDRTTVIPLGVDAAFFEAAPDNGTLAPSQTLLYVGKRLGYKDFSLLLDVLDREPFRSEPVDLWTVGGEPMDEAERRALRHSSGIGDFRHFDSLADHELVARYHAADACVITSKYEGFGLPALEAMAAACPLASSTGGSLAEVVEGRAFTFAPGDGTECASAIVSALQADSHSPEVMAGREFAAAHTWERTADRTLDVLAKVAADANR